MVYCCKEREQFLVDEQPVLATLVYMEGQKDFDVWNRKKKLLEERKVAPNFSERDIWWCAIGVNVGYEEDGKHQNFERPVCVLRKFNKDIFIGVPLTSIQKDNPYYFPHKLHETEGSILLSQARIFSAKRLERKLGHIGKGRFVALRKQYRNLFF
jgi:mRNA interferase MazF